MFCLISFCGFSIFNVSCVWLQFQHVECGLSEWGFIMLPLSFSTLNACCVWMKLYHDERLLRLDKTWLCSMHVVLAWSFIMLNAHFVWVRFYHDECMFCLSEALHVECMLCFGVTTYRSAGSHWNAGGQQLCRRSWMDTRDYTKTYHVLYHILGLYLTSTPVFTGLQGLR